MKYLSLLLVLLAGCAPSPVPHVDTTNAIDQTTFSPIKPDEPTPLTQEQFAILRAYMWARNFDPNTPVPAILSEIFPKPIPDQISTPAAPTVCPTCHAEACRCVTCVCSTDGACLDPQPVKTVAMPQAMRRVKVCGPNGCSIIEVPVEPPAEQSSPQRQAACGQSSWRFNGPIAKGFRRMTGKQ